MVPPGQELLNSKFHHPQVTPCAAEHTHRTKHHGRKAAAASCLDFALLYSLTYPRKRPWIFIHFSVLKTQDAKPSYFYGRRSLLFGIRQPNMSPVPHLRKCALLSIKQCHFNNSLLCLGGSGLRKRWSEENTGSQYLDRHKVGKLGSLISVLFVFFSLAVSSHRLDQTPPASIKGPSFDLTMWHIFRCIPIINQRKQKWVCVRARRNSGERIYSTSV